MRPPAVSHRLEYAGFRLAAWLASAFPESLALRCGAALGTLTYRLVRIRRADVERHLACVFPERPESWRRAVALACYRHLGREGMALLRLARLGREEIVARTPIQGLDALTRAIAEGRGALVLTGHLGNWEIAAAALAARGLPIDVVARTQANPLFDRALGELRERLGMRVIRQAEAPRQVLRSLRAGRVVGLLSDQDARRAGVFVKFCGMPASTARGPALFALRARAPVFVGVALRPAGGGATYDLRLREVAVHPSGVVDEDVRRITQAHVQVLEDFVREAPSQYFWQHRRWKTRPVQEQASGRQV
ncbi:MAG: lysophospholipid acyltransferase family protein [Gemmatimonadetes bacterium]|nr:lysophospholipid acyltransferase family protein [Gemmatimonadota bacterium]